MASIRALKSHIRSVSSTKQITSAMQLVAASKMRRAEEATTASAAYSQEARELLTRLSQHRTVATHPLFAERPVKSRLVIAIASDKGLAGAYNSNVIRLFTNELTTDRKNGVNTTVIAVGRRFARFVARIKDVRVSEVYEELPDRPESTTLRAILNAAIDQFTAGDIDAVDVIYTQFISHLTQTAMIQRILPVGFEAAEIDVHEGDATYEPGGDEVIDAVAERLIGTQIYQALLEARASEHSMRMIAMKSASDNARDLIDDLRLAMNKTRQAAITQELAEISGGVEAMNG